MKDGSSYFCQSPMHYLLMEFSELRHVSCVQLLKTVFSLCGEGYIYVSRASLSYILKEKKTLCYFSSVNYIFPSLFCLR